MDVNHLGSDYQTSRGPRVQLNRRFGVGSPATPPARTQHAGVRCVCTRSAKCFRAWNGASG